VWVPSARARGRAFGSSVGFAQRAPARPNVAVSEKEPPVRSPHTLADPSSQKDRNILTSTRGPTSTK
jgi:hypothetical protein